MRLQAYKITGFAAVAAAVGFMLRWLQNMKIYEELTGLADRTAPINYWVIGMIVLTAGILLAWVIWLKSYPALLDHHALVGKSVLSTIIGCFAGILLALSGVILLFTAGSYARPVFRRILALFQILGGLSALLDSIYAAKAQQIRTRQIGSVLLVLYGCFFMVVLYEENAVDPVIWRFAPEILAACVSTLALYYAAGYQYGEAKPYSCIFCCYLGLFFCVMSIIDAGVTVDAAAYLALALLLGMYGFVQVENLEKPGVIGVKQ